MSVLAPKPIQRADANPTFEQLLDSEEAASFLKIHPKTLQKMARSGEVAGVSSRQAVAFPRLGFEGVAVTKCPSVERAFLCGSIILCASEVASMRRIRQAGKTAKASSVRTGMIL